MTPAELPGWAQCLWLPKRHIGLHGGRGGAKSRSIGTALVIQSAQEHRRILCGREVQKSIKASVKRLLDDEIDRLKLRPRFVSTDNEIRGPNDSLFLFAGIKGNATGIKSIEGVTDFWGEEAQTFSQASIETVIPTIRTPNSRLIWSWNPHLPTDPIDVMFRGPDGPPPNSHVQEVNYDGNLWFPDVLRDEMEYLKGRDFEAYQHIWLGQYRQNSEARIFRNWTVDDFDTPPGSEFRQGADFGFSIDPSCLIRCFIEGRRLYVDHEAWGLKIEINNLPNLFMAVPDAERWPTTADSSRPETISYLRNHGFPHMRSAIKGARSVEEGVEFLKSFDIVVHSRCVRTIAELSRYSYKTDSLTGEVLPEIEDKDNHLIDALRYACEGARRAKVNKPAPVVSIPRLQTAFNRR